MDVDIDFATDFDPLTVFPRVVRASQYNDGKLTKHSAGTYFQTMPVDAVTNIAAIPYNHADEYGFFKFDFLHLSAIDDFSKYLSKAEMRELVEIEPNWSLLHQPAAVEKLIQVHSYGNLLNKVKPTSVMMLADVIALVRPSKRLLVHEYVKCTTEEERDVLRKVLYAKPEDGKYYFKKPHSVGYAATIVIQLHLIEAGLL